MRKINNKTLLSKILVFLLLINIFPVNSYFAYAEDDETLLEEVMQETVTWTNPLYEDLHININQLYTSNNESRAAAVTFSSKEKAAEYVRNQMVKRSTVISFNINEPFNVDLINEIFSKAVEYNDKYSSSEGDYLMAHYSGYSATISGCSGQISIVYNMNYLSTEEEEVRVNTEVKKVLDKLNVYNADDYTKIKAVHDYIMNNIHYDYSYSKYSAYNALIEKSVVCQGYSSLTYKMLKELGVGVRIITGKGNGGNHAWNIVRINGKWYNIDNTWDSNYTDAYGSLRYDWFLLSNGDFVNHTRDGKYNTSAFNSSYPMSNESFVLVPLTSIALNRTSLTLEKGKENTLTVSFIPSNATNQKVSWSSNNTAVATVDRNGKVKGIANGTAVITATSMDGNKKATCTVTVKTASVAVTSVSLNKTSLSLLKGKESTLTATINPSNATNKGVTWTSNNTKVATVDSKGKIKAVAAGTATITVKTKDGSKTSSCKVTVTNPVAVTSVKLNKTSLSIVKGQASTLTATINPSNATNKNVTWTSNNTKVVTVDANGKVKAIAAGTATITVKTKDGSKTSSCKVTVKNPVAVTSVKLSKTSLTLAKGKQTALTATINPSNATNKNVTWTSSNTKVATVDSKGNVKAVAKGTATIKVTTKDGNKTSTCKVTVK